ncbi:alpha/beta hydrolase family protein [Serinibacter arcticus]|uniref:Hydrolase of the alpha/beta superfamily n=1 Tax=Serinibacter arcticus TaxID=1655435 RepID=A0A4Z1DZM5_9MICO|nr:alpha/beta hydrolase [Serinibacter arcticus]TGO04379.1 hydrolase of the alpha/beta superfamily [Serinibacter arcticus]
MRTAWAVLISVTVLALVGAAAGPRWNPVPLSATVGVASDSVAVEGSTGASAVGRYETVSRIVEVELVPAGPDGDGAITTDVLIVTPVGLEEPAPAVVFLHGAGTGSAAAFTEHAEALASAGVVALSPSKRLDTYSTLERDYVAMAADYARTLALALQLPEVDPARVGLYAESEGAWIAPILAADNPDVAFVALISAPVVTPRQQGAFAVDAYLRAVGVPQTFLRAIPRATGAHWPAGVLSYADFDVLPYLERTDQPIFMAYGTADLSMPTVQGPQIVRGAIPGGGERLMLRYYAGANHGIRIGDATAPVVPAFLDGLATWMLDPAAAEAAGPAVAGATPEQIHLASAVPQPRWYADGEMMLRVPMISAGVLVGGLLALLGGSVALAATERRRRRGAVATAGADAARDDDGGVVASSVDPDDADLDTSVVGHAPRLVRRLVAFAVGTLAVVLVLASYIVVVAQLALSYSTNGVVVWGGWVLVQALAVISVWLGLRAVRRLVDERRGHGIPGFVRVAGGWLIVAGLLGLLVVSAYWGAFSPVS